MAMEARPDRRMFLATSTATVVSTTLSIGSSHLSAADGSVARDADGDVYQANVKLKTPRKSKDKRAGHLLDRASFSIFVPRGTQKLRGAVLNPFYEATVNQAHWRAAVAHWGFALIGTNLFGVRGEEFGETVLAALETLAATAGHSELRHAPLCFHGMSAGGGMATRLVEALPDRTIAAAPVCLEVGPRSEASRRVPMLTIFGERDGRQMERLLEKLPTERAADAQWAIAPQWGRKHEWYWANNLIVPFYDRVIAARFPQDVNLASGPVKLRAFDTKAGWSGDPTTWQDPLPQITSGSKPGCCWLPDQYTAAVWQAFVAHKPPLKIAAPPGMSGRTEFSIHRAGQPIDVRIAVDKQVEIEKLELYNGHQPLCGIAVDSSTGTIVNPRPGVYSLIAVATLSGGQRVVSAPNAILVAE